MLSYTSFVCDHTLLVSSIEKWNTYKYNHFWSVIELTDIILWYNYFFWWIKLRVRSPRVSSKWKPLGRPWTSKTLVTPNHTNCHPKLDSGSHSTSTTPVTLNFIQRQGLPRGFHKFPHSGFSRSIKSIFHCRCHFFSCFSLAMASLMYWNSSKYTNNFSLYLAVNRLPSPRICLSIR